jgi:hypothetical protein
MQVAVWANRILFSKWVLFRITYIFSSQDKSIAEVLICLLTYYYVYKIGNALG